MKEPFIFLSLSILFYSCQPDAKMDERELIFSQLYNDDQIQSEFFEVNSQRDTTLFSKNGTTIKLYSQSFVTKDSVLFSGSITLELKEAFKPIDYVLGNLTTNTNGQLLTSGGMIYLQAEADGKELGLKEGSEIGFFVPTVSVDESMMVYNGSRDSNQLMNWESPEPILNSKLRTLEESYITITYGYLGDLNKSNEAFLAWLWKPERKEGDETTIDSVPISIVEIAKDFVSLRENEDGLFIPDVITNKGQNGFLEDYNTNYIFSVKNLGWANIDKLFSNPAAEEVEMLTTISNHQDFGHVFTTLLLPEQNMYIPGYQKKDNSYGYTHNDFENLILPIGSKGHVLATAYKDGKPYFKLEPLTIGRNMNLSFQLTETTPEELKKLLEESI